jgi:N-formylglutamate amidohydrolase
MIDECPLFASIPHSGELVPDGCAWLKTLAEPVLMCDVDRFVDRLYEPALVVLKIPFVKTKWHRYAADLNRIPEDVDCDSVIGNRNPAGSFSRGFHWVITTTKIKLMNAPMSEILHGELVSLVYNPFHNSIRGQYQHYSSLGFKNVFHLDLHSMPSLGTSEHRDPGELRADIVVSDCQGKSCSPQFTELVIKSYRDQGFKVAHNWPYLGGRITEQYGNPSNGHHAIQVELNRSLYMDEQSKKLLESKAKDLAVRLQSALQDIRQNLKY